MKHLKLFILTLVALFADATTFGAEIENSIPIKDVKPGATVLEWTADQTATLSGYYLRMTNCMPPEEAPIVGALFVNGERVDLGLEIPIFERPLRDYSIPYPLNPKVFPPHDVGLEYRRAVEPIALKSGDVVRIAIESCEENVQTGVTAGLQFQGVHPLASMRAPFRECRTNGPVCSIPWSEPEVVAIGSQEKFDPRCAPQNNSSVIADKDGTLYIFCAYYSVDEQYGGGRTGSYSRIIGYKKAPGADKWEDIGIVVDLMEGQTYSGDPYVFRDLDGRPCILFCFCDGTNGFTDWKVGGNAIVRSKTDSFSGPWEDPIFLWSNYPQYPDDKKNGGRANCVRIFPRQETQDYLVLWNHGSLDMDIRGVVMKNFDKQLTFEEVSNAPMFVRNQEEGGGGCVYGNKGYYSTWQIPWLNDPNGQQRLYEVDLTEPITPESWRVVPGSIGSNDGANPKRDGGTTADAWAFSVVGDRIYATSCEYSSTENKNYLYVRSAPLKDFEEYVKGVKSDDVVFKYGAAIPDLYKETFPTLEYAIGRQFSLEYDFRSYGEYAYSLVYLCAWFSQAVCQSICFELNSDGARLIAYKNEDTRANDARDVLAKSDAVKWEPGKTYRIKFVRDGANIKCSVDGNQVIDLTIDDEEILNNLDNQPRLKFYGWRGGTYEISNAVLTDGKE